MTEQSRVEQSGAEQEEGSKHWTYLSELLEASMRFKKAKSKPQQSPQSSASLLYNTTQSEEE